MHSYFHCSIIYNSQNMETTHQQELMCPPKICQITKYPSTDEQIKKMWYIYTMEYTPTLKKSAILLVVTTQIKHKTQQPHIKSLNIQRSVVCIHATVLHLSSKSIFSLCQLLERPVMTYCVSFSGLPYQIHKLGELRYFSHSSGVQKYKINVLAGLCSF